MASNDELQAYYERDRERDRLGSGRGEVEFLRTIELVARTLPAAPALVADIGGGPGRYTDWLVDQGHSVVHRDIVPHHVEQVREQHGDSVDTAVGDARDLGDLDDHSVDAVLLLGPLYHLEDLADRVRVLKEAARVTKPGGMIYAACISRWAARIQAILVDRNYLEYPETLESIDQVDDTGVLKPVIVGGFNGYTHTADAFRAEVNIDELDVLAVFGIEGPAAAFTEDDVTARLGDPLHRKVLLDSLRALESVPELLGLSSHLLAVARRL